MAGALYEYITCLLPVDECKGENPMAGPFELEFGFFGQRQQLDEISA